MERLLTHIRTYLRWYILLLFLIISLSLWSLVYYEGGRGELKFEVLDIGQGDSLFIESPTGIQVLVDGGPHRNLIKEISKAVSFYDKHIDMLVVTNPDADHYEGFISLLDKYSVDVVLEPGTANPYPAYGVLEDKIRQKGIQKILARRGQKIDIGGGAYIEILFPDRDVSGLSSNDGSIVARLVYGKTSVLLQGDSTEKIEHYLVSTYNEDIKSTILKVGHHGSRTSTSREYVEKAKPEIAVISSGRNNDYGHPHKETLETLRSLNIPAYDTCNNGDLIFVSDGENFFFKNKNPKIATLGCKY